MHRGEQKQVRRAIGTLDTDTKHISLKEFGKVALKAHLWCAKWGQQQKNKKTQKDKLDAKTSAQDQTATVKWKDDASGGLNCDYVDQKTMKPHTGQRKTTCDSSYKFSPTNSFLQKWNNARNNYLRKDKSFYDAKQTHKSSIEQSNMAAEGFKDEIDDLARVKVKECDVTRKTGVLADVKEFNDENAKRATLYRSIKVIACHVQSMDERQAIKSLNKSNLNKCISNLTSEGDLKKNKFQDIPKPTKFCPTEQEYRAKLKLKHSLNLHYTGDTKAIVTDSSGDVSTKYGWYPRTQQCADVKKKATLKFKPWGDETYLGCFDSPRNQHGYINDLPGGSKYVKMVSGKANPLKFCREQCASLGKKNGNKYTWYALEYGGGCHCGTNFAGKTNKRKPDSDCERGGGYGISGCKCGFPYYCGGAWRIAAYSMTVGSTAHGGRPVDKKWKAATCPNYKSAGGK